jgi:hypothetical protein
MDRTLFAALIGAAGGSVVWLCNWLWLPYSERKLSNRIRTMLSIELEENLIALRAFSSSAQDHVTLTAPHIAKLQRGDQFATAALPPWKRDIWTGLLASLPLALQEDDIRAVHQCYFELDELTKLKASSRGVSSGHEWFEAFDVKVHSLLQRGNPLRRS